MHDFVHLRLHSEFSITDSILRINKAINNASAQHMFAFALTDHHTMFGLLKFYTDHW